MSRPVRPSAQESAALDRRRFLAYGGAGAAGLVLSADPGAARAAPVVAPRRKTPLGEVPRGVTSTAEAVTLAADSGWGGHVNGKIPASALTAVLASFPGSGWLRQDAAEQYFQMANAFASATGRPLVVTEGYRSYDRQVEYWNRYQAGTGNLAAYPGTSNHGWGTAADFGSGVATMGTAEKRWMDAHAPGFGWEPTGNGFSQPEAWHFDYTRPWPGERDVPNGLSIVIARCTGVLPGVGTGYVAALGVRTLRHLTSPTAVTALQSLGVPYREVSSAQFLDAMAALAVPATALTGDSSYYQR